MVQHANEKYKANVDRAMLFSGLIFTFDEVEKAITFKAHF